jgi:aspartate carbamoyltransferase catalytic subunit
MATPLESVYQEPRQFNGNFETDFLSVQQLTIADLNLVHEEADAMRWMANSRGVDDLLQGHVYNLVFWDSASTRTKYSFDHAIKRLGGQSVVFDQAASSSGKGETFEDTIEMIDAYLVPRDAIIVRHNKAGSLAIAAEIADVPVINAGDGTGEHPTQAVLDTKTIRKRFASNLPEANIVFFGDLAHARTVNSTAPLLAKLGARRMTFVAPEEALRLSPDILENLRAEGVEIMESDDLREVAPDADLIYGTRTQYELMHPGDKTAQQEARLRYTGKCMITEDKVQGSRALWMHPLPEDQADLNLEPHLRRDPRCIYKEQASNGEWTRMALLARLAGKSLWQEYRATGPHLDGRPNLSVVEG